MLSKPSLHAECSLSSQKNTRQTDSSWPNTSKRQKYAYLESDDDRVMDYYCWICHKLGEDFSCQHCPRVFHLHCLKKSFPEFVNDDKCPECKQKNFEVLNQSSFLTTRTLQEILTFVVDAFRRKNKKDPSKNVLFQWPNVGNNKLVKIVDFNLIEDNIKDEINAYTTFGEVVSDLKWIHHNCYIVDKNRANSTIAKEADAFVKAFLKEISDIQDCPMCYYRMFIAKKSSNFFEEVCNPPHDIVWAWLRGSSPWPAKCLRVENGKAHVRFFGTHDNSNIPLGKKCLAISLYHPAYKKSKITDENLIPRKHDYKVAVKELLRYIKNYEVHFGKFPLCEVGTLYKVEKEVGKPGRKKRKSGRRSRAANNQISEIYVGIPENSNNHVSSENTNGHATAEINNGQIIPENINERVTPESTSEHVTPEGHVSLDNTDKHVTPFENTEEDVAPSEHTDENVINLENTDEHVINLENTDEHVSDLKNTDEHVTPEYSCEEVIPLEYSVKHDIYLKNLYQLFTLPPSNENSDALSQSFGNDSQGSHTREHPKSQGVMKNGEAGQEPENYAASQQLVDDMCHALAALFSEFKRLYSAYQEVTFENEKYERGEEKEMLHKIISKLEQKKEDLKKKFCEGKVKASQKNIYLKIFVDNCRTVLNGLFEEYQKSSRKLKEKLKDFRMQKHNEVLEEVEYFGTKLEILTEEQKLVEEERGELQTLENLEREREYSVKESLHGVHIRRQTILKEKQYIQQLQIKINELRIRKAEEEQEAFIFRTMDKFFKNLRDKLVADAQSS